MKTLLVLAAVLAAAILNPQLCAETADEREFKQARADREKALAAAAEPINRRYKDILDRLFRKVTQAGQLDLAKEIQAELQVIGGTPAATAAGGVGGLQAAPAAAAGATGGKADLRKFVEDTQWVAANGGTIVFRRGGTVQSEKIGGALLGKFYTLEAPDVLKVYNRDPSQDRKAEFMFFRVNLATKTAEQDVAASTIGGHVVLTYSGPAKAAK